MDKDFPFYGTVSHGTMRNADLIPCFASLLKELDTDGYYSGLTDDADNMKDFESDKAYCLLDSLWDSLADYAPAGYYFGAHPGDGSDYGFWAVDCDE